MATFKAQVEGLTSLSISSSGTTPTEDELSQFLKDGVVDVTNKSVLINPRDALLFTRSSSESTSQYGLSTSVGRIISVVRETGTDGDWRNCSLAPISLQSRLTDTSSLHYASKYNPAYVIGGDGAIGVFPAPAGSNNAYKIYYVNSTPVNTSDSALVHSHSDINYFPEDRVYLVALYAAISSVKAKIATYTVDEEDSELVQSYANTYNALRLSYDTFFGTAAKQVMKANNPPSTEEQLSRPLAEQEEE